MTIKPLYLDNPVLQAFEDEKTANAVWPPGQDDANPMLGGMSPLGGGQANQNAIPDPSVPGADDGIADARAIDPSVSVQELLGLDPEQVARQQQREIDADNEEFETMVRFHIAEGIPRSEWPPELIEWVKGLSAGGSGFRAVP